MESESLFDKINAAPENVRRRWAFILFLGTLPFIAGLFWLSFRASISQNRGNNFFEAIRVNSSDAYAKILRGFGNIRSSLEVLYEELSATPAPTSTDMNAGKTRIHLPIAK